MARINTILDISFSIILIFLSPILAGYAFSIFIEGDKIAKLSSNAIILVSILLFGIACMGLLKRLSSYFQKKALN